MLLPGVHNRAHLLLFADQVWQAVRIVDILHVIVVLVLLCTCLFVMLLTRGHSLCGHARACRCARGCDDKFHA